MSKMLDKMEPSEHPVEKTKELHQVRGYVAPTETGSVRVVKSHEKLIEVDVKEKGSKEPAKQETTPTEEPKVKGTSTPKEVADKLSELSSAVKEADFSKPTDALSKQITDFYRGGVNTSKNARLDTPDGIRSIYEELNRSLTSIGFENPYNLSPKEAMIKISDPKYMESIGGKLEAVEKRLGELGLKSTRLDPFTLAIEDAESKANRIYISTNPLDFISSHDIKGEITEKNASILASANQDKMNDFVFYTANKEKGGVKTAVATASFDPKSGKFYHHKDPIAVGSVKQDVAAVQSTIRDKLKSKQTVHEHRTFADMEVGEVRAMIGERLTSMQNQIEKEVEDDGNTDAFAKGDEIFNPKNIGEFFGDIVQHMMQGMNSSFNKFASKVNPKSLAYNSPLHSAVMQFRGAHDDIIAAITQGIESYRPQWDRFKKGYMKR